MRRNTQQACNFNIKVTRLGESIGKKRKTSLVLLLSLHLLVLGLELVGEGKLGSLLLELGELVLVLGHLLQGGLDELALHVADGHVELVDLEVAKDDLALQEEHLALEVVPRRKNNNIFSS